MSFNQGVTGSRPVRPSCSSPLAYLLSQFLNSRRQGTSLRTDIASNSRRKVQFATAYVALEIAVNLHCD